MDSNAVGIISEIINSPDIMKNLQSVLSQIGNENEKNQELIINDDVKSNEITQLTQTLANSGILTSAMSFLSSNKSERIALLNALRPFLSEEKKAVLDSILQILQIASILFAGNILKG